MPLHGIMDWIQAFWMLSKHCTSWVTSQLLLPSISFYLCVSVHRWTCMCLFSWTWVSWEAEEGIKSLGAKVVASQLMWTLGIKLCWAISPVLSPYFMTWLHLVSFSYLFSLARMSSTVLTNNGEKSIIVLFLIFLWIFCCCCCF